jgi:HSP20 family protein
MANIIRWHPFGELARRGWAMDRLFDESAFWPWRALGWEAAGTYVPVDVYETDEHLVFEASMPGLKPEQVDVSISGGVLTIKGETTAEEEERKPHYHRQERRYGAFRRSFTLPEGVDAEKAEAVVEDGVLTLSIPKAEASKPKTIKVKARGLIEAKKA